MSDPIRQMKLGQKEELKEQLLKLYENIKTFKQAIATQLYTTDDPLEFDADNVFINAQSLRATKAEYTTIHAKIKKLNEELGII